MPDLSSTKLEQWALQQRPIVDARSSDCFSTAHCAGAVNLPFSDWFSLRQELPVPGTELFLIADEPAAAKQRLLEWGYGVVAAMQWTDSLAKTLDNARLLRKGCASHYLWQPNELLQRFLPRLSFPQTDQRLRALDVACGSGRDAVFLAKNDFDVLAWDWNEEALQRAQSMAKRHQVSISTACVDLESASFEVPKNAFELVHVARYLHRPLLAQLQAAVTPGGLLMYETFAVGAEKFGSPKNPNFLLRPQELASVYQSMEIVFDAIEFLADGRPVQRFIARQR